MKSRNLVLIIVVFIILILGGCGCNGYNNMIKLDEDVKAKWGTVQADYQRRSNLIPNLVETVKGYANFEQETLIKVTEARAKATSVNITADNLTPENMAKFQQAQSEVTGALSRLLVSVEKYPDLKANENFLKLQDELAGTENRIKNSIMDFNSSVQGYNTTVRRFPNNLFANMFGFRVKETFKAEPGSEKVPDVKFTK